MRLLLLITFVCAPALAQPQSGATPSLTPEQAKQFERNVRAVKPPPFFFRKDGTRFGRRPKPPKSASLGKWLVFINRTVNPRSLK